MENKTSGHKLIILAACMVLSVVLIFQWVRLTSSEEVHRTFYKKQIEESQNLSKGLSSDELAEIFKEQVGDKMEVGSSYSDEAKTILLLIYISDLDKVPDEQMETAKEHIAKLSGIYKEKVDFNITIALFQKNNEHYIAARNGRITYDCRYD